MKDKNFKILKILQILSRIIIRHTLIFLKLYYLIVLNSTCFLYDQREKKRRNFYTPRGIKLGFHALESTYIYIYIYIYIYWYFYLKWLLWNYYQPLTLSQKARTLCEYHVFNLFWGHEKGVDSGRTAPETFCVVPSLTTFCVVND